MKIFFKILASLLVAGLVALIIVPYFFKDELIKLAGETANENLKATVQFNDVSLSLFRSFPDFSLKLEDLSVIGRETFDGDTLVSLGSFEIQVDLMSVLKGEQYIVRSIALEDMNLSLHTLRDGTVNWDVALPADDKEEMAAQTDPELEDTVSSQPFSLALESFSIRDASVHYLDEQLGIEAVLVKLNEQLTGNFSSSRTILSNYFSVDEFTFLMDGIQYVKKTRVSSDVVLDADLDEMNFVFDRFNLKLNSLQLSSKGKVSLQDSTVLMDVVFDGGKSDFKSLLSMVPALFMKDFEGLVCSGEVGVKGFVQGSYYTNHLPAFGLSVLVNEGSFHYPDLPMGVERIAMDLNIDNPGGLVDNTVINLKQLIFDVEGNVMDMGLTLRRPVSDPVIALHAKGDFDFGTVEKIYPLDEEMKLEGKLNVAMNVKTTMSALESENYGSVEAAGTAHIVDFVAELDVLPLPFEIPTATLLFSPQQLQLNGMQLNLGENDISANGIVKNYLGYVLTNGVLYGELTTTSKQMNINDFIVQEENIQGSHPVEMSPDTLTPDTSQVLQAVKVPMDIDFVMKSTFGHLIYDKTELFDVNGDVKISQGVITLTDLSANTMGGQIKIDGYYSGVEKKSPQANMNFNMQNIDIPKAAVSFASFGKIVPLALKSTGLLSAQISVNTVLDEAMMPLYNTMNASGRLTSRNIGLNNVNVLERIAEITKISKFKKLALADVDISFEVIDGKMHVKPFDLKLGEINGKVYGTSGFDETIDYVMELNMPRSVLGKEAGALIDKLSGAAANLGVNYNMAEIIPVNLFITGTVTDPVVKTGLRNATGQAVDDLKNKAKEALEQKRREAEAKIRKEMEKQLAAAKIQAGKLIDEAKNQAGKIRKAATDAAAKIRSEADVQAEKLIKEGKKKGPLGAIAGKKAAEKLRIESDKKAKTVENEGFKKADKLVAEAQKNADEIIHAAEIKIKP